MCVCALCTAATPRRRLQYDEEAMISSNKTNLLDFCVLMCR